MWVFLKRLGLILLSILVFGILSGRTEMGGTKSFQILIMSINGPLATLLVASILDYFGYRRFKKTHRGAKYDKDYYLHDFVKEDPKDSPINRRKGDGRWRRK